MEFIEFSWRLMANDIMMFRKGLNSRQKINAAPHGIRINFMIIPCWQHDRKVPLFLVQQNFLHSLFPFKKKPRKRTHSLPERKRMKTSLKLQNKNVLSTNNAFYYQMLCNLKTKNKSKYYFYLSVCMCYIIDTCSKVNFFCFCFRNAH